MERDANILLALWREACQHIEIGECVERVTPLLAQRMPIGWVVVRRLDPRRSALETIAAAAAGGDGVPAAQRSEFEPEQLERFAAWSREGQVAHEDAQRLRARWPGALPDEIHGDVLAVPLRGGDGVIGVLLLVARAPRRFGGDDERLAGALLEPLSVALANDWRVHEMAVLREAAEADRQTLLSRLGRREMSETIVGVDAGLHAVMDRVERVAGVDVPVLILGETGSGKEVVARAIHARSSRAAGPFMRVNCGAIPAGLIDSELFGHERGSFTGAVGERKGWFERADKGTLFLDEVGELPLEAQVRLLRVLQDGTLERVGGHRSLAVDVRIVAATHRDLQAMIQAARFREDLWYRIAIFPIHLPPLRDRVEDIPDLARHFALRAATRFGRSPLAPTSEDMDLLIRYPWPGNVRELGAVMERAVILGDGRRLEVARALGPIPAPAQAPSAIEPVPRSDPRDVIRFLTLEEANSATHRRGARADARSRRRSRRRGRPAGHQSPHAARSHAQAAHRLGSLPHAANARGRPRRSGRARRVERLRRRMRRPDPARALDPAPRTREKTGGRVPALASELLCGAAPRGVCEEDDVSRSEPRPRDEGTPSAGGFALAGACFYVWDEDARSAAAWAAELKASAPPREPATRRE